MTHPRLVRVLVAVGLVAGAVLLGAPGTAVPVPVSHEVLTQPVPPVPSPDPPVPTVSTVPTVPTLPGVPGTTAVPAGPGLPSLPGFDCKTSPEPDRPGTGLVGSLDPPTYGQGTPGSVYHEVGYAGLVWHNYDIGCSGAAFNPATSTDTWLGNQTFNVAKFLVAAVNWAHYLIADGSELLAPLDDVIRTGTTAMYEAVFTTWIGPALLVLAVIMLVLALRGDLARQTQRATFAVLALLIGSAAYLAPVDWARGADTLLLDGVTQMQEGFLGQVGLGDRDTLPTLLVDQVVYSNWQRGMFGSPDAPQAQELGRQVLQAQTFTKQEVAEGRDTLELGEQKKADFALLAGQMGDRYPYFTGKAGSRVGAGVLALVQAVCIALFQLLSKVLVLVAMLVLRLMVMTAPAIAVLAVLKPEILPALLRIGGAAIVNTLVVGALAGLHALMVVSLFRPGSPVDLWLALLVTGVVTIVLWAVARPFRRLVSMVSLTREQFGGIVPGVGDGPVSRMWGRLRGAPDGPDRQTRWWDDRRSGERPADLTDTDRPEAAVPAARRPVPEPEPPPPVVAPVRRSLPGGVPEPRPAEDRGSWGDAETDERVIYRRADAVPLRPGAPRAVQPELVDGVPVYRIYRPRTAGSSAPVYDRVD